MVHVDTENLLNIESFAKAAKISRQAVHKAINESRLKYVTISGVKFIDKKEVEKFRKH